MGKRSYLTSVSDLSKLSSILHAVMAHIATVKIGMLDYTFPVILTVQVRLEDMLFNEEKKVQSTPH